MHCRERTVADLIQAGCTTVEQLLNTPKYFNMLGSLQQNNALWAVHSACPVTRYHIEVIVVSPKSSTSVGPS